MELTLTATSTPIAATLARAAGQIEYFSGSYGERPDDWLLASEVIDDPDALSTLLDQVLALYQTDNRQIGAAFLVLGYFWSPMLAMMACFTLDGRVPDLTPDSVAFDLRGGVRFTSPAFHALPSDPATGQPEVTLLPDHDALRDQLVAQLEAHANPLFTTLRAVAPYGLNGMRANYIDRLVSAIIWISEALGDQEIARREVPAFVSRLTTKHRAGIIEVCHEGRVGIYQQRSGCCLNYRLPGKEKCDTCSLHPLEKRLQIFRGLMSDQTSAGPSD
ncbi:MAG TPA: (2Fe-2S)-binding protein [Thermomicrobiales bacterium]|nr:(2Fe-2S)-binding protein [Thermomicrobiales bacterium]